MRKTRAVVNTALIVGAVIVVQYIVLEIFNYAYELAQQAAGELRGLDSPRLVPYLIGDFFSEILYALGFAAGVFLCLKVIRPISASSSWKSTILRGILASVFGAAGVFVVHVCEALLGSVRIGPYPFGYSFDASFDPNNFGLEVFNAVGSLLTPFVYNVPLVVVACVLLKVWLGRQDVEVTAPASAAAKP